MGTEPQYLKRIVYTGHTLTLYLRLFDLHLGNVSWESIESNGAIIPLRLGNSKSIPERSISSHMSRMVITPDFPVEGNDNAANSRKKSINENDIPPACSDLFHPHPKLA